MVKRLLAALLLALPAAAQDDKKPALEPLKVDEKAKSVSFGAVALKLDIQPQLKGVIEYLIVNKGGKDYESCFQAEVDPVALYEGLKKIGVAPGKPGGEDDNGKFVAPTGGKLRAFVEIKDGDAWKREPIEKYVLDTATGKSMEPVEWLFTGSREGFIPELEKSGLQVLVTKNVMALIQTDATVLVTNPVAAKDGHRYKGNKSALPPAGTAVRIVFEPVK